MKIRCSESGKNSENFRLKRGRVMFATRHTSSIDNSSDRRGEKGARTLRRLIAAFELQRCGHECAIFISSDIGRFERASFRHSKCAQRVEARSNEGLSNPTDTTHRSNRYYSQNTVLTSDSRDFRFVVIENSLSRVRHDVNYPTSSFRRTGQKICIFVVCRKIRGTKNPLQRGSF